VRTKAACDVLSETLTRSTGRCSPQQIKRGIQAHVVVIRLRAIFVAGKPFRRSGLTWEGHSRANLKKMGSEITDRILTRGRPSISLSKIRKLKFGIRMRSRPYRQAEQLLLCKESAAVN
jgi:hypothetical protein